MKTLINAVSVIATILVVIVSIMGTVAQALPVVVCLVLVILFFRSASACVINSRIERDVEDTSVLDIEFVSLADAIGFELFLEFVEEEDFDISGDFEDGVIICWISNPEGTPLTTMQLEGLLEMQKFLCQWA